MPQHSVNHPDLVVETHLYYDYDPKVKTWTCKTCKTVYRSTTSPGGTLRKHVLKKHLALARELNNKPAQEVVITNNKSTNEEQTMVAVFIEGVVAISPCGFWISLTFGQPL